MRDSQLKIIHSNHLPFLLDRLADRLLKEPLLPMEKETIIVQSQGMRRWVKLKIAGRYTVAANIDMPFPGSFCRYLCGEVFGFEEDLAMRRDVLEWRIFCLLGAADRLGCIGDNSAIKRYINDDQHGRRRYQLAYRTAALFDDYQLYRTELIHKWISCHESSSLTLPHEKWQADIFRELHRRSGKFCLSQQIEQAIQKLKGPTVRLPFKRLSVFGVTSLPPRFIDLLVALSWHIPLDIYYVNPCRTYWADLPHIRHQLHQMMRDLTTDDQVFTLENPLLSSLGRQAQEFFSLLLDKDETGNAWGSDSLYKEPPKDSFRLLHQVQRHVLEFENRTRTKASVDDSDRSISIHSCHSQLREMQVLRDQLLDAFHTIDDLRPHQVLVMMPDITTYTPYIDAVFGVISDDGPRLPYSIADRVDESSLLIQQVPVKLLRLTYSRTSVSEVLDLLVVDAIARKFHIGEDELPEIRTLVERAGIRWGRDREHRSSYGLPSVGTATWQQGLDRLLLGYAMGEVNIPDQEILPSGDATNDSVDLMIRLVSFFTELKTIIDKMVVPQTLLSWSELLCRAFSSLIEPGNDQESRAITALFKACSELRALHSFVEQDRPQCCRVEAAVMADYFEGLCTDEGFGHGFIDGRITFCSLKPMRSIPFKVIALCGMNQEDFPRSVHNPAFDLMAHDPKTGDRNVQIDDRYLFLESILSAEHRLVITYLGQDSKTNRDRPPSICISELLDYMDEEFSVCREGSVPQQIVIKHPLHPFSKLYFEGDNNLFTYSQTAYQVVDHTESRGQNVGGFIFNPLPISEDNRTLQLEDLIQFWCNPSKYFCQNRLDLRFKEESETNLDSEPFQVDSLDRYLLGSEWVRQVILRDKTGFGVNDLLLLEQAAKIPSDKLGKLLMQRLLSEAETFAKQIHSECSNIDCAASIPIDITIETQGAHYRVMGVVAGVLPETLFQYKFANIKIRDSIRTWVSYVTLSAQSNSDMNAVLLGTNAAQRWSIGNASAVLVSLIDGYLAGRATPLPFFEVASRKYADLWLRNLELEDSHKHRIALDAVINTWQQTQMDLLGATPWSRGDREDPAVSLCYCSDDAILQHQEAFSRWSLEFWLPYFEAQRSYRQK